MPETYNFSQIAENFLSNPNSYKQLHIIPCRGEVIGKEQIKRIAEVLETNKTVTTLSYCSSSGYEPMGYEPMGDEVAEAFAKMLKNNKTITEFHCESNLSTVDDQKLVEALKENTSIKKLLLVCPNIGDEGIKAIVLALEHNKTITSVNFSNSELTDDQILVFTDSLKKNKTVTDVTIVGNNNEITAAGIQHIYDMLDSNPRIITGHFYLSPGEGMQESEKASFLSTLESCKYNLNPLYKLAKFVNNNLESFVGEFDVTSNPKHLSALKFYQQSNKDSLSEWLKLINPAINPEKVLTQLNSYINYNLFSLTGVFKTPQNEDVLSVIGEHLNLWDIKSDDIVN
ncbi:MAG: hypothetical protein LN563_01760 [Rickettsia endosymbiont of Platyusa sonomae]|nr:hypothetical protein [Rickettsia endosymbiont of Platyusa sonomae]